MKIYIVTSGEYSDYHIDAVFLDRQKALQYCAANEISEDVSVEGWETADESIEGSKTVNRKYLGFIERGEIRIVGKLYTFAKVGCEFDRNGLWFAGKPMANNARFVCVFPIGMGIDKVRKAIQDHFAKWAYETDLELAGEKD